MVDTLLDFLAKGVLGEEHFNHLNEVVEEVRRQLVKPVRGHNFQTSRKGEARGWIVAGVDYHLVSKVVDVLHQITYSRVAVECRHSSRFFTLGSL